ncbi:MAG: hypothetical protein WAP74_00945 [Patescibacteria group bacterium]
MATTSAGRDKWYNPVSTFERNQAIVVKNIGGGVRSSKDDPDFFVVETSGLGPIWVPQGNDVDGTPHLRIEVHPEISGEYFGGGMIDVSGYGNNTYAILASATEEELCELFERNGLEFPGVTARYELLPKLVKVS